MANPIWPLDLPQELVIEGMNGQLPDAILRTEMDAGPAKSRRRFTGAVEPISGAVYMTAAQLASFKTFFKTTIQFRALPFDWKHPITEETVAMKFVTPPTWAAVDVDDFRVQLELEILP